MFNDTEAENNAYTFITDSINTMTYTLNTRTTQLRLTTLYLCTYIRVNPYARAYTSEHILDTHCSTGLRISVAFWNERTNLNRRQTHTGKPVGGWFENADP